MVLEKMMKPKQFTYLVYAVGIILEVIGFGLLFNFEKTMTYIHQYPTAFSILLIFSGYIVAVAIRFRGGRR